VGFGIIFMNFKNGRRMVFYSSCFYFRKH